MHNKRHTSDRTQRKEIMKGYIEISSPKGGVGTSTAACGISVALSKAGNKVLLIDMRTGGDISALMGMEHPENIDIVGENSGHSYPDGIHGYDYIVIDAGNQTFDYPPHVPLRRIGVVRNEYLALREVVNKNKPLKHAYDEYIAFIFPNNVLNSSDVSSVIQGKVTFVDIDDRVSRAIDAGLFYSRWENLCSEWSNAIAFTNREAV